MSNKIIDTGSDFSGVGAFDQALERMGIVQNKIFACDMDKYARQTYILNYGEPKYYPLDVYDRIIPKESLDVYMTSPPCQGFSMAGNRNGSILFLNSHEFIKVNKPRFLIFENVKGLLSHDKRNKKHKYGNTFNEWINYLGGKSVNGNPTIFPHKNAVPYHIYHFVLNAKEHGIPQNRERVFIVGIRDDDDNIFSIPKKEHLNKKLIDLLEENVNKKYNLSKKAIRGFIHSEATKRLGSHDGSFIYINENTKKGYTKAMIGDGFYINRPHQKRGVVQRESVPCIKTSMDIGILDENCIIRKLTPRECFRSMDFNDGFKLDVSDTQAYKQAGNSIPVGLLVKILSKLNL